MDAPNDEENIQVETLEGEWANALAALHGLSVAPDVKPLAALLKRGPPVPEEVAEVLGRLLDPPWGDRGPRLVLKDPDRWSHGRAMREIRVKRELRSRMLADYQRVRSKKRVIESYAGQTGCSEAYLHECWALDNATTVRLVEAIFTQGVRSRATRKASLG